MTGPETHWLTLAVVLGGGLAIFVIALLAGSLPRPVRRTRTTT